MLYKIAHLDEWENAREMGRLDGTAVDLADGFIHFSTAAQLRETLNKHYRQDSAALMLISIDPERLPSDALRWEPARGGDLFPHLYVPLPFSAVIAERRLERHADGSFDLPEIAQ